MFINHVIYEPISLQNEKVTPMNNRYRQYFIDLYDRYQQNIDINLDARVYSHDEMGEKLLKSISQVSALDKIEAMFFSHDGFSWESHYSSPELFLKERFKINADIYDIKEIGILCVFCAIHLMLSLYNTYQYINSVCCSIENAWACDVKSAVVPEVDYIGAILFSDFYNSYLKIKVLYSDIVHKQNIEVYCKEKLILFDINCKSTICYVRRINTKYLSTLYDKLTLNVVDYMHSSGFIYFCMHDILGVNKKTMFQNMLIIDYDDSLSLFGFIFLQLQM